MAKIFFMVGLYSYLSSIYLLLFKTNYYQVKLFCFTLSEYLLIEAIASLYKKLVVQFDICLI